MLKIYWINDSFLDDLKTHQIQESQSLRNSKIIPFVIFPLTMAWLDYFVLAMDSSPNPISGFGLTYLSSINFLHLDKHPEALFSMNPMFPSKICSLPFITWEFLTDPLFKKSAFFMPDYGFSDLDQPFIYFGAVMKDKKNPGPIIIEPKTQISWLLICLCLTPEGKYLGFCFGLCIWIPGLVINSSFPSTTPTLDMALIPGLDYNIGNLLLTSCPPLGTTHHQNPLARSYSPK